MCSNDLMALGKHVLCYQTQGPHEMWTEGMENLQLKIYDFGYADIYIVAWKSVL